MRRNTLAALIYRHTMILDALLLASEPRGMPLWQQMGKHIKQHLIKRSWLLHEHEMASVRNKQHFVAMCCSYALAVMRMLAIAAATSILLLLQGLAHALCCSWVHPVIAAIDESHWGFQASYAVLHGRHCPCKGFEQPSQCKLQ